MGQVWLILGRRVGHFGPRDGRFSPIWAFLGAPRRPTSVKLGTPTRPILVDVGGLLLHCALAMVPPLIEINLHVRQPLMLQLKLVM